MSNEMKKARLYKIDRYLGMIINSSMVMTVVVVGYLLIRK
jgi:hypothetical protein